MSDGRSKGKLIRHAALVACVCSSLYYVPTLLEKLNSSRSATDTLLTQYLPAEAKARLEELEASGGIVTTDKGLEVPQYYINVRRTDPHAEDRQQPKKQIHTTGEDASSGARTVSGGS